MRHAARDEKAPCTSLALWSDMTVGFNQMPIIANHVRLQQIFSLKASQIGPGSICRAHLHFSLFMEPLNVHLYVYM